VRLIRSVEDLSDGDIDWVMTRSRLHHLGQTDRRLGGKVVTLVFLEPSLRTRVGFAAAAARLGATPVEVVNLREGRESTPESMDDTLRTLAGYSDIIVSRPGQPLAVPPLLPVPVLNAGDRGPAAEHPSQALIDLYAMQQLPFDLAAATVALVGDLRMRAARSLLAMLTRRRPRRLILTTEPELMDGFELPSALAGIAEHRSLDGLSSTDVLYVVGIPYPGLDHAGRDRLRISRHHLDQLPDHAVVLSPLPIIDELQRDAFDHPRARFFEQSDAGLYVRMALLELLVDSEAEAHGP
jgi:aspartate carbamoyltransferase catalytic subunit